MTTVPATEIDPAVATAFRLPRPAVVLGVLSLVAVGLVSAASGAAGLPIGGVVASLVDRLPLVSID